VTGVQTCALPISTNAVDHMDDFMEEEVENAIEWLKKGKADWGNAVIVPLY